MPNPFGALLFNASSVSSRPAFAGSGAELWGTEGDGASVQGSVFDAYAWNKCGGEISAAIQGFGIALDMNNPQQLMTLLLGALAGIAATAPMPALSDCNAPALGRQVYSPSSANTPAGSDYGALITESTTGNPAPANGNTLFQEAYDVSAQSPKYFRFNVNNAGWTAWRQYTSVDEFAITTDGAGNVKRSAPLFGSATPWIEISGAFSLNATIATPQLVTLPFGGFPNVCLHAMGNFGGDITFNVACGVSNVVGNKTQIQANLSSAPGGAPIGIWYRAVGN